MKQMKLHIYIYIDMADKHNDFCGSIYTLITLTFVLPHYIIRTMMFAINPLYIKAIKEHIT